MSRSGNLIRDAMEQLASDQLRGAEHPPTERLLAYQRDEIRPAEAETIAEHVSLCRECAALVLDASDFFADDEAERATAFPAESGQGLQAVPQVSLASASKPAALDSPRSIRQRPLVGSLALAYGVAAAAAAVSVSLLVLRPSQSSRPQVNTRLYDLTSSGSERGVGATTTAIRFRSPTDSALLILNPSFVPKQAALRYGVRILDVGGAVLWHSNDLVPQTSGAFHVTLPARALQPGSYSLKLYGITDGRKTVLGTYEIVTEK